MRLGFGLGLTDFGAKGGVADTPDSGSLASALLLAYGTEGLSMDFTDQSLRVIDSGTPANDTNTTGRVLNGSLVGPGSIITNAGGNKLLMQADGYIKFGPHNLYVNSATPADQSVTVVSGATYAITITGSVSITWSGAYTGTTTAGTTTLTAASGTLTGGSTSGSGTVHVYRTPAVSDYIATGASPIYSIPYEYSSGVCSGIRVEPQATNLAVYSNFGSTWAGQVATLTPLYATGPDGTQSAALLECTATHLASAMQNIVTGAGTFTLSFYAKMLSGTGNAHCICYNATDGEQNSADVAINADTWTLVSGTFTVTVGTSGFYVANGQDGNIARDFLIAEAQLESGSTPTSRIKTYASTVTRVDNLSVATSLFPFAIGPSTLYAAISDGPKVDGTRVLSLYDSVRFADVYRVDSSSVANFTNHTSGGSTYLSASLDYTASNKLAIAFADNDLATAANGTLGDTDTSITIDADAATLAIGAFPVGSNTGNFILSSIAYWPTRVSDSNMQTLTT